MLKDRNKATTNETCATLVNVSTRRNNVTLFRLRVILLTNRLLLNMKKNVRKRTLTNRLRNNFLIDGLRRNAVMITTILLKLSMVLIRIIRRNNVRPTRKATTLISVTLMKTVTGMNSPIRYLKRRGPRAGTKRSNILLATYNVALRNSFAVNLSRPPNLTTGHQQRKDEARKRIHFGLPTLFHLHRNNSVTTNSNIIVLLTVPVANSITIIMNKNTPSIPIRKLDRRHTSTIGRFIGNYKVLIMRVTRDHTL